MKLPVLAKSAVIAFTLVCLLDVAFAYFVLVNKWLGGVGKSLADASLSLDQPSSRSTIVHVQMLLRDLPAELGLIGGLYLLVHFAMLIFLGIAFLVCIKSVQSSAHFKS